MFPQCSSYVYFLTARPQDAATDSFQDVATPRLGARPQPAIHKKKCQTVCKPGSVPAEAGDGHSSGTPVTGRLVRPTRAAARKPTRREYPACRPYLVLLPVGFTVPPPSPGTRCALTAPFHPYPPSRHGRYGGRFAFCGTFPRVAPAGDYPAPCSRGARTFLPRRGKPRRRQPSDRLALRR